MNFARMIWSQVPEFQSTFDSGKRQIWIWKSTHRLLLYWMHAKIKKNCIIAEASYTMSVPWQGVLVPQMEKVLTRRENMNENL